MQKNRVFFLLMIVMALLAIVLACACGSTGCALPSSSSGLIWQLRVPRVLGAFAVGGLLSLAGALMQLLLRNPLADPYVLGVSGGAATGALAVSWLLPATILAYGMQLGALCGALIATALLFGLARRALIVSLPALPAAPAGIRLILTGVMLSAGFGACITLMLAVAPDAQLRGMMFWLMGDLDAPQFILPAWLILAAVSIWACANATYLNVLSHGDMVAQLLGLHVASLRIRILLLASVATATAVSVAGAIGFIGLVVPHGLRLVLGNDQRALLPASVLAGGAALVLADLLARSIIAPVQLPVGVITVLIGVPVFLAMLTRSR